MPGTEHQGGMYGRRNAGGHMRRTERRGRNTRDGTPGGAYAGDGTPGTAFPTGSGGDRMDWPNRRGHRYSGWDYSQNGYYFITICTHNKRPILATAIPGAPHVPDTVGNAVPGVPLLPDMQPPSGIPSALGAPPQPPSGVPPIPGIPSAPGVPLPPGMPSASGVSLEMTPTAIGHIILRAWANMSNIDAHIKIDRFCLMPNHIHGIIVIDDPPSTINDMEYGEYREGAAYQVGAERRGRRSLQDLVRGFKSATTREYNMLVPEDMKNTLWQSSFYDVIIKNEDMLCKIRAYIDENPMKWLEDELYG